MSTRDDATLSAAERAALAGLEAQAEAEDPRLAAHLRGRHALPTFQVPPALVRALRTWIGPCAVVAGLATMILALSQSTVVSLIGTLLFVVGGLFSTSLVCSGLGAAGRMLPGREPGQDNGDPSRPAGA